jgi:hypothetical protein
MGVRPPRRRSGPMRRAAAAGQRPPRSARRHAQPRGRLRARRRWRCFGCGRRGFPRRAGSCGRGQDFRRAHPQHPAERAERATQRRRRRGEKCGELGIAEETFELRARPHRLRHQFQQPAEALRQLVRLSGPGIGGPAARSKTAENIFSVADAGGEPGEALVDAAEAVDDQPDQRVAEPVPAAARRHGSAEPPEQGGEALGRCGGWGHGHAVS